MEKGRKMCGEKAGGTKKKHLEEEEEEVSVERQVEDGGEGCKVSGAEEEKGRESSEEVEKELS